MLRRCERRSLPNLLRAKIMLRQGGRCFDCGTRMRLGFFVFDHRPPLALRAETENANDPDRLVAICRTCIFGFVIGVSAERFPRPIDGLLD